MSGDAPENPCNLAAPKPMLPHMNVIKSLILLLTAVSGSYASAQNKRPVHFSLQGGVNIARYEVTLSTIPSDEYPELRRGLGNYVKATAGLPLLKFLNLNIAGGLSAERLSSEVM